MDIVEHEVAGGVPEFLGLLRGYPGPVWIYRGQADRSWELVPKAGRVECYSPEWEEKRAADPSLPPRDLGRFRAWCQQAVAHADSLPDDPFECLAYAQHYGLATRLLDWTTNPLVALYFAADTHEDVDGLVYCHLPGYNVNTEVAGLDWDYPRPPRYTPRPFDQRVIAQQAVFTYHSQPQAPLCPASPADVLASLAPGGVDLVRPVIRAGLKPTILRELACIGIDRKRLFPGLDGLSDVINRETRESVKFASMSDAASS